jgi:ABC-type antimicrobial peptide transport system permease subunit
MALGAQRQDVIRMVLRESLSLVGVGMAIGIAVSLAAGRLIASQLYGLPAHDGTAIAGAIVILTAVSALAGYLPARRASRVDPLHALRHD